MFRSGSWYGASGAASAGSSTLGFMFSPAPVDAPEEASGDMEEIAPAAPTAGIAAHGSDVPATVDETNLALPAAPAPPSGSVAYAGTPEIPEDAAPGCAAAMPDVIVATASAAWAAATPPDMAPAAAPAIAPMVEDTVRGMTLPRASSDVSAACPCRLAAWENGSSPAYRSSDASSVFSADLRRNRRENHPPFASPESDSVSSVPSWAGTPSANARVSSPSPTRTSLGN